MNEFWSVLVCKLFGHRWPLMRKYDNGRLPLICSRCSIIVGYGEQEPYQPILRHVITAIAIGAFIGFLVAALLVTLA